MALKAACEAVTFLAAQLRCVVVALVISKEALKVEAAWQASQLDPVEDLDLRAWDEVTSTTITPIAAEYERSCLLTMNWIDCLFIASICL